MEKLTLMAAIAATWAATAGAASVELVTGYKSFVDFSVEFTTKPQETCLAATLTRVSLQGGATKADIPAVLTHSADYGDLVVVSVRGSAFSGCAALKELVLPESLTNVAAGAFAPCAKLGRVTFEGAPPAGLAAAGLARDVVLYYNGEFADDWAAAVAACGFTHAHEIKAVEPATVYAVTFAAGADAPAGTVVPGETNYWERGISWSLAKPVYESSGKTFDGWKFGDTDYVANEIPSGTEGDLVLTAMWLTARTVGVKTNGADTASVEIKVSENWIAENVKGEKTDENIQAALNATEANGNAQWQNYVIGLDPTNSVAGIAKQDDSETKVSVIPNAVAPKSDTGFTVRYSLDQVDTNGTVVAAGEATTADNLGIDLEAVSSNAFFRMNVVVTKDGDSGAQPTTVVSTNVLGVLKVEKAPKAAIVAVPWNDLGGQDVKVSGFVKTASLTEDDELRIYQTNGTYSTWRLNAEKKWVSMDEEEKFADVETIPRGSAVWLMRQDTTRPIVLFGQASESKAETKLEQKKDDGKPSWNVVAAPSVAPLDLNEKFNSSTKASVEGDQVIVPTDGAPKNYTYENGQWGYSDAVTATTNKLGIIKVQHVRVTDDTKVPAGTGFWYLNSDSKKANVNW